MQSNFATDLQQSEAASMFLDRYCYPKMFDDFKRYVDKQHQYSGIDLTVSKNGKNVMVDEKVMLSGLNEKPRRFWFELSAKTRNQANNIYPGWFVNPEMKTEAYTIVFFPETTVPGNRGLAHPSQIRSWETLLINKNDLKQYIYDTRGMRDEELLWFANRVRNSKERIDFYPGIWIETSQRYMEAPTNLIITKPHLDRVAKLVSTGRLD